ncbi:MAG: methyl-accepting chemotaxis protein [Proteobacteria bacterium]|nr:methyl-accepting chemotaxis protein [Pseudomonadota bacterium]MBU1688766.1 methyl-accepting chemotaxis protein [Pseudomonadota bacterium]
MMLMSPPNGNPQIDPTKISPRRLKQTLAKIFQGGLSAGRFHFFAANRLLKLNDRISLLRESIAQTAKGYEPHFLGLGRELQSIYSDANTLTKQTIQTAGQINDDSADSPLPRLREQIQISLNGLKECQNGIINNLSNLEEQGQQISVLSRTSQELEKIALFLKVTAVNVGIEATRSEEAIQMFSLTAGEIGALGKKIITVSDNIERDTTAAAKVQNTIHHEISLKQLAFQGYGLDAEATVKKAVGNIELLVRNAMTAMEQTAGYAKSIAAQTGEIVVGIQFHDNMSQRLEHVVETLEEIETSFTSASKPEQTERIITAHSLFTLQATQLRQVINEIDQVYRQNAVAFENIKQEIEQIALVLRSLCDPTPDREDRDSSTSPFAHLKTSLDHLINLLSQGQKITNEIEQGVEQAASTSKRLLTYMDLINATAFEIKVQALNAIIKAAHLGEKGNTLVVLAHEMNNLSDTTDRFVSEVSQVYRAMAAQTELGSMGDTSDQNQLRGSNLKSAITDIEAISALLDTTAQNATAQATALTDAIIKTSDSMTFLSEMSDRLGGNLAEAEAIIAQLAEWCHGVNTTTMDGAMAKVADRYTMDQERLVHHRLTSAESSSAQDQGIDAATDEVLWFDEDGSTSDPISEEITPYKEADNIVLFDNVQDTSPAEATGNGEDLTADVLFFAPPGPPEENIIAENGENQTEEEDLGTNVELF